MSDITLGGDVDLRARLVADGLMRKAGATARFASDAEILSPRWRYRPHDPTIILGHHAGQLIGLARNDQHMLTVAGSRTGKGISLIVPNLVTWPGSCLVLDPKGELARMTARARRELHGQEVLVLDPFSVSGLPGGSLNLLDDIDLASPTVVADLQLLLESLIVASSSQSDGEHWVAGARELVLALCLYAKVYFHRPTLVTVHELLSGSHGSVLGSLEAPSEVLGALMESTELNGALRSLAIRVLEIPDREQGSILSTARRQLAWLEGLNNPDAAITRVCAPSDLRLADLKRRNVTIYLCLPASYLEAYKGWMRSVVNLAMAALENTPSRPGAPPVLLLLDEFITLGKMKSLERAAGLLAGSGVRLWPIVQDLGQLKSVYGERYQTFIGNSGVSTFFGFGGDELTADYVAKRLGTTQYYERDEPGGAFVDRATTGLLHGGGRWVNSQLMHPHELELGFARETGRILCLSAGTPPMVLQRNSILQGFLKEWVDV